MNGNSLLLGHFLPSALLESSSPLRRLTSTSSDSGDSGVDPVGLQNQPERSTSKERSLVLSTRTENLRRRCPVVSGTGRIGTFLSILRPSEHLSQRHENSSGWILQVEEAFIIYDRYSGRHRGRATSEGFGSSLRSSAACRIRFCHLHGYGNDKGGLFDPNFQSSWKKGSIVALLVVPVRVLRSRLNVREPWNGKISWPITKVILTITNPFVRVRSSTSLREEECWSSPRLVDNVDPSPPSPSFTSLPMCPSSYPICYDQYRQSSPNLLNHLGGWIVNPSFHPIFNPQQHQPPFGNCRMSRTRAASLLCLF